MDDKFILMGLDDDTSNIAEVLKNKTCKRILDFLAETKEASEKDISKSLGMPINTIEYDINKLIKSGLVDKSRNFFWSTKGRKINMYKLARKHIIISPSKKPNLNYLKSILPAIFIALALLALMVFMFPEQKPIKQELKQFASYDELKDFVKESSETGRYYGVEEMTVATGVAPAAAKAEAEAGGGAEDFSQTNIQVEGVDEADIVKNDGKYIYVVTGNKIAIVDAYPAENMKILNEIEFNESDSVSEIFINDNKLVIFASGYEYVPYSETKCSAEYGYKGGCGGSSTYKSLIYIYDIENKEEPKLEQEIEADGNYVNSRMIGDYVYVISTKYVQVDRPEPPVYIMNGVEKKVAAGEIYYWDYPDTSYVFTSIMAIDVKSGDFNSEVYLTGYTGTIYVSQDNIYLTHEKRISAKEYNEKLVNEVYLAVLPGSEKEKVEKIMASGKSVYEKQREISELVQDYSESLTGNEKADFDKKLMKAFEDFEKNIAKENEKTIVNKINVNKDKIEHKGTGEVPGHVLNQFSMDEYEGNLRIATTTGNWGENSLNNVYILDKDLKIVGKLEDLAEGERIFSARFMGNRCYLVTFEAIDPLFVIDLSEPEKPKVLGYLKIPGYSDYLHPYDENHIIGIGRDVNASIDEEKVHSSHAVYYTAVLGVKISLFDVSDVENPVEVDKYVIGERGTESPVLSEHKAFLFDKKRNLLVLPVNVAELVKESNEWGEYENSKIVWQGAYVFNVEDSGIELKGKITHDDNIGNESYYPDYKYSIKRSLYMDDALYTISNSKIKANNLETVEEISKIDLPYEENYPYTLYETVRGV